MTEVGNCKYTCEYDGITRTFLLYAPSEAPKGIIIMLHGAGSDGEAFRLMTGMDSVACERGYAVAYVYGTVNPYSQSADSTGWNSGIAARGQDDIGFLCSLASYLQDKYSLTRDETFAVGFSNGAFMTYRIAAEGQKSFGATVSVAGMMPQRIWNNKTDKSNISLLQISGNKDDVVPMNSNGTAATSVNPAIEDVMAYFAEAAGLNKYSSEEISDKSTLYKYTGEGSELKVWRIEISEGRHSWPEEKFAGFNTNEMILSFLDSCM